MLLILQNRGKQSAAELSRELEVSTRTIMRDVEALHEAGLPVVVHQGSRGGIELGFNYRTRLTGLSRTEAEALGVIMASSIPLVATVGVESEARRALSKILESLPDAVRATVIESRNRFDLKAKDTSPLKSSELLEALAISIEHANTLTVSSSDTDVRTVHPVKLQETSSGWLLWDAIKPDLPIRIEDIEEINISAKTF